ncbi:propionate--CoA ligase [Usitatibacter palustris]|uniref:Propionate--CoA ligase n=1 Tax=Usitatibacter palustris TaxID=2732487 RepID=A0A6M4H941_9PROT|nr:propionate--CoA ligase [Usitatibacter palustris]QJR14904.1 Acetyl-coenzyme A synthetase [Usitatibacter palustris]
MKAIYLTKEPNFVARLADVDEASLPEGDVTVKVEYSTLNYKDALALTNASPIVRTWPLVAGIDFAGVVEESTHPDWKPGDKVILNGWGVGESHWGGLAQKARVKGDWLVRVPEGMTTRQAMAIGTAGYTAALCVMALEDQGVTKDKGEILVTGATGGVGSVAIALLARRGYRVVGSTGKASESAYLKSLGATEVIDRATLTQMGKPLQKERWAGVVDSVGSHTLMNACAQTKSEGVVTACGLAQGMDFPASVAPFILRGVSLIGVNSVMAPRERRVRAWGLLAKDLRPERLESMVKEISLEDALARASDFLVGKVRGRLLVNILQLDKKPEPAPVPVPAPAPEPVSAPAPAPAPIAAMPATADVEKTIPPASPAPPAPPRKKVPRNDETLTLLTGFYLGSVANPERFWEGQSKLIDWWKPPVKTLDYSNPPFCKWFVGGETNLCYNAVDRHMVDRANQKALVWISTEVDQTREFTYAQLLDEVNRFAATLYYMGVGKGDRVLIYMPMVPEAVFAMLATVRLGAVHSVVFGGFAAASLAARIDDAQPKVIVTSDAGMRMGKMIALKPLVDESIALAKSPPQHVLLVNRGLDKSMTMVEGRDVDYAPEREKHAGVKVPVEWLESNAPSYILYTSGTTGQPKGVQRDTGGYAVALAASMRHIFCSKPGEAFFSTSDIGWVVGHSYIVYGPLINGSTTIMYEGVPMRPDAGIWWKIVQDYKVTSMFSSPTAIRVLKKQDTSWMKKYDTSSLRYLFLAGEPLDEPTSNWISEGLGVPIVDNYWQTETGWPILTASPGIEDTKRKVGSPSFPAYGYTVKLKHEETGEEVGANEKGVLCIVPPLPPGAMTTVWGDDQRYVDTYYKSFADEMVYTTFDWATRDEDGYYFVLGRTDDVINVAGHRLGTREIEEAVQAHANIAEVAVVGVADALKGQVPVAFAVCKDASKVATEELRAAHEKEVMATVDSQIGAIARPSRVHFVTLLPKTRSGKLLRRSIQAICEGRDPGDLTTIEDPGALEQVRAALK